MKRRRFLKLAGTALASLGLKLDGSQVDNDRPLVTEDYASFFGNETCEHAGLGQRYQTFTNGRKSIESFDGGKTWKARKGVVPLTYLDG